MKRDADNANDHRTAPFVLRLPQWLAAAHAASNGAQFERVEQRMAFAIDLARQNVARGGGGPFGAAVFTADGRLVSVGVNLVVAAGSSLWHAEMVAIAEAQRAAGMHRLRPAEAAAGDAAAGYELVTSCEPCAMCLGAIGWSGVTRVICGARDADVRAIGFDEGHKPPDWQRGLAERGIAVVSDVLRAEAVAVLEEYATRGGEIY